MARALEKSELRSDYGENGIADDNRSSHIAKCRQQLKQ